MFATGVSGKALGAYAGLSFVFIAPDALPARAIESVPAYFDVMRALGECEPLFTMPSPLLAALDCALELQYATRGAVEGRMAEYQRLGAWTRERLREASLTPLVAEVHAAPTITTFAAPVHGFADMCRRLGFEIASESGYLKERGWAQIGIMGAIDRATLKPLFRALSRRRMAAANS
jgi:aspartate aminotransferase-like enzyme